MKSFHTREKPCFLVRLHRTFYTIPKTSICETVWILKEDYLSTRSKAGLFDPKPRSSEIELRLGPSQIKVFSLYFINF
jgi:hypothetical protein